MAPGNIAIVTDSTADFAGLDLTNLAITIVPLTVNWGRDILRDRIDLTTTDFYLRLRTDHTPPHTAAPPLGIFEEVYRNLLDVYDDILSVHLSASFSATWGVAQSAAETVDPRHIRVLDSTSVSLGLGWLAHRAAVLAATASSVDEIEAELRSMIPRLGMYVSLDTLEYLHRGGRIGRAQAFLGGLLNVKPILLIQNGEVQPYERVRTRAGSLRRLAELSAAAGPKELIAVAHGDAEADAHTLRDEIARREGPGQIPVAEIGAVIGTHTGPGLVGVGYLLAE